MPYTDAALNLMLGAIDATHAAVFNGDPAGAGTQIGARQSITLAAASGGVRTLSGVPEFTIPAGQTVTHVAYFNAVSSGAMRVSKAVTNETFGEEGTYRLTEGTLTVSNVA